MAHPSLKRVMGEVAMFSIPSTSRADACSEVSSVQ